MHLFTIYFKIKINLLRNNQLNFNLYQNINIKKTILI